MLILFTKQQVRPYKENGHYSFKMYVIYTLVLMVWMCDILYY